MHNQRIAALACAIVGASTTFFPWASLLKDTKGAVTGLPFGWHVLSLFGLVLILVIQGSRTACVPRTHTVIASAAFLLAAWVSYEKIQYLQSVAGTHPVLPWFSIGAAALGIVLLWVLRRKCHTR